MSCGHLVATSCGLEHDQSNADNRRLLRFNVAVSPFVVPREARNTEHVDQVLFGHIVLLVDVALEGRKDFALLQQMVATFGLDLDLADISQNGTCGGDLFFGGKSSLWWSDGKIVELFSQDNDGLFVQQWVLGRQVVVCCNRVGQPLRLASHLGLVVKVKDIVHAGGIKVDIDDLVLQRDGLVRIVVVVIIAVRVAAAKDEAVGEHDDEDGLWERDQNLTVNLEASPT